MEDKYDIFKDIWISNDNDYNYHNKITYDHLYMKKVINKSDVLNAFSPTQILDMLDDKDIELYLRNKKLKKITNKIR